MRNILFYTLVCASISIPSFSQNFPGPVGDVSTTAIFKDDARVDYWLEDSVQITRGFVDISNPSLGHVTYGDVEYALGESDPNVISLGDGGQAIYVLSNPIFDQDGDDFAVFENAFDNHFLEFAFVEVSTDGENYVRFPNQSNTDVDEQTGSFGASYTEYVNNLAGKYRAQYGTPFDLHDLSDSLSIDITSINYIRIVDVVGSINPTYASYDSYGNIINDPWPTPFNSSGFDLDAVAILQPVELNLNEWSNEFYFENNQLFLSHSITNLECQIFDMSGKQIWSQSIQSNNIEFGFLTQGIYVLRISGNGQVWNEKINIE